MEKVLAETEQGTLLHVLVVPQGKEFAIVGFDEWSRSLKVRVREKAEKGKANRELLEQLRNLFCAEVVLANGEKQRKKLLLVKAGKAHVLRCLSAFSGKP